MIRKLANTVYAALGAPRKNQKEAECEPRGQQNKRAGQASPPRRAARWSSAARSDGGFGNAKAESRQHPGAAPSPGAGVAPLRPLPGITA